MKAKTISDTRQRIVDTASKLFYTQGYNSTGINQIIEEAEVAKASLYQYFPSKEDLLIEYLRVTAGATNEALRAELNKHDTPKEKVLGLFDFLLQFVNPTGFYGCNFLNIASEVPKENEKVRSLIKNQKNHIRALFAEVLKPLGKEYLADELYLLFDAVLIASKVHDDVWPAETAKRVVERIV